MKPAGETCKGRSEVVCACSAAAKSNTSVIFIAWLPTSDSPTRSGRRSERQGCRLRKECGTNGDSGDIANASTCPLALLHGDPHGTHPHDLSRDLPRLGLLDPAHVVIAGLAFLRGRVLKRERYDAISDGRRVNDIVVLDYHNALTRLGSPYAP